ncbi:MAG TPA: hypothetical protein VLX85_12430 [Stellaceae bacterium]|nr:hypothetical protein [Stellaceae bacterium]
MFELSKTSGTGSSDGGGPERAGDRPRLQQKEAPALERPFDVLRLAEGALDAKQCLTQLGEVAGADRARSRGCRDNAARFLEDIVVAIDLAGDEPVAPARHRGNDDAIAPPAHRIGREGDSGGARRHHLLHDHRRTAAPGIEPPRGAIGAETLDEPGTPHPRAGVHQVDAGNGEQRQELTGMRVPRAVLLATRGADRERPGAQRGDRAEKRGATGRGHAVSRKRVGGQGDEGRHVEAAGDEPRQRGGLAADQRHGAALRATDERRRHRKTRPRKGAKPALA